MTGRPTTEQFGCPAPALLPSSCGTPVSRRRQTPPSTSSVCLSGGAVYIVGSAWAGGDLAEGEYDSLCNSGPFHLQPTEITPRNRGPWKDS